MHSLYEQREEYLHHALEVMPEEQARIDEYAAWLPSHVIDAHAHANLPEHVDFIHDSAYNHMLSTFPSFSIEESSASHELLHPGIDIRTLRFAKTFKGIAHRAANQYLLEQSPDKDRVALFGLPEDPNYTIEMLSHPRVSALKMYYSYLQPPATTVYEAFPPAILAAAEERGVAVVMHAPKMIVNSLDDVIQTTRDFPDLKIALAHLGSSKFDVPGLQEAYDRLAGETTLYADTALNPSPEVVTRALNTFGSDRIMYGSDEPLNLIRSVPYVHPERGQRIATKFAYHWQNPEEHAQYHHLADSAIHAHWLSLDALRAAIEAQPNAKQAVIKQAIFHDNAARFYGFEA